MARQVKQIGRDDMLRMRVDAEGAIYIGGVSVTCIDGTLRLPDAEP